MKTSERARPISSSSCLEQPPGLADERQALLVLVRAGRLADEHQVGVGVARAEDDRGARRGELRAARAGLRLLPDRLELLAPRLRRGHAAHDSSGSGGSPGRGWSLRALSSVEDQPVSHARTGPEPTTLTAIAIVGAGRLGTALAAALRATGLEIEGPLGRGADPRRRRRGAAVRAGRRDRGRGGGADAARAGRPLLGRDRARRARRPRGVRRCTR